MYTQDWRTICSVRKDLQLIGKAALGNLAVWLFQDKWFAGHNLNLLENGLAAYVHTKQDVQKIISSHYNIIGTSDVGNWSPKSVPSLLVG